MEINNKTKIINLTEKDISEIKFLASQGEYDINRTRLIKNLYRINDRELEGILFQT